MVVVVVRRLVLCEVPRLACAGVLVMMLALRTRGGSQPSEGDTKTTTIDRAACDQAVVPDHLSVRLLMPLLRFPCYVLFTSKGHGKRPRNLL